MVKDIKIWGVRSGMIGDMIMALPILNYAHLLYPNSYKYWVIGRRFSQAAPLFINHPMIDKIHILKSPEALTYFDDINICKSCDIQIDITPQHPDGIPAVNCFWWNKYNLCEETFRMAGLDVDKYRKMPEVLKKPKLEPWFSIDRYDNTIAIWPFAAYGKEPGRSPSLKYVTSLIRYIMGMGYNVRLFGHPNDPKLKTEFPNYADKYQDFSYLSFFDQIKMSLGCNVCINTDSGSGWVLGAYGMRQISLLTNHAPNHTENLLSFAPENYKSNNINLFSESNCDNINQELIIESIKKLI